MGFIGRWLSDAVRLGLALAFAVLAMQVPALTRDYANGLLQASDNARRDIDQREAAARQFYHLSATDDDGMITALTPLEPSNAQTLAVSVGRAQTLRVAYARIAAGQPQLRPVIAAVDVIGQEHADKWAILRTALDSYTPQLLLSQDAAIYGVAGLVVGAFLAQLALSVLGAAVAGRRRIGPEGRARGA